MKTINLQIHEFLKEAREFGRKYATQDNLTPSLKEEMIYDFALWQEDFVELPEPEPEEDFNDAPYRIALARTRGIHSTPLLGSADDPIDTEVLIRLQYPY